MRPVLIILLYHNLGISDIEENTRKRKSRVGIQDVKKGAIRKNLQEKNGVERKEKTGEKQIGVNNMAVMIVVETEREAGRSIVRNQGNIEDEHCTKHYTHHAHCTLPPVL